MHRVRSARKPIILLRLDYARRQCAVVGRTLDSGHQSIVHHNLSYFSISPATADRASEKFNTAHATGTHIQTLVRHLHFCS